jgi:hypothetical protein
VVGCGLAILTIRLLFVDVSEVAPQLLMPHEEGAQ